MRLVSAHTTVEPRCRKRIHHVSLMDYGAIQGAMDRAGWTTADVGQVYCDLNGEAYRAHEWMLALCRCIDDAKRINPAETVWPMRPAAFGPLLSVRPQRRCSRGYRGATGHPFARQMVDFVDGLS